MFICVHAHDSFSEALSIHGAHLDLTFAHARFETRLRERGWTINHAAVSDIETRLVPRTFDHVAFQLALRQWTTQVRARVGQRAHLALQALPKPSHTALHESNSDLSVAASPPDVRRGYAPPQSSVE